MMSGVHDLIYIVYGINTCIHVCMYMYTCIEIISI